MELDSATMPKDMVAQVLKNTVLVETYGKCA